MHKWQNPETSKCLFTNVAIWKPFQEAGFFQSTWCLYRGIQWPDICVRNLSWEWHFTAWTNWDLVSFPSFSCWNEEFLI